MGSRRIITAQDDGADDDGGIWMVLLLWRFGRSVPYLATSRPSQFALTSKLPGCWLSCDPVRRVDWYSDIREQQVGRLRKKVVKFERKFSIRMAVFN